MKPLLNKVKGSMVINVIYDKTQSNVFWQVDEEIGSPIKDLIMNQVWSPVWVGEWRKY